jgi:hypothetical protein
LKNKPARKFAKSSTNAAASPFLTSYDLFRAGIRFRSETLPIDALRVFNAATTLRRYNRYAFKYAQMRLPATAASDAHHAEAIGTAHTILNTDDLSVRHSAQLVKSNQRTSIISPARQRTEA